MRNFILVALLLWPCLALAERGQVVRSFSTPGQCPTGLAFDGKLLWVADHKEDRLVAVDPVTGSTVRSITAPSWHVVALGFDGVHLWSVDGAERRAYRLAPLTGTWDRSLELEAKAPRGMCFANGRMWVSDASRGGWLHEVDPEDGTTIRMIPAPSKGVTGCAILRGAMWVAERLDDRLYAVDPTSGEIYFHIPSPGPYPFGMAAIGGDLAVADYQKDEVVLIRSDHRDPTRPYRRSDPREVSLEFLYRLRNMGPDPLKQVEIFVAIPKDQPWQEILGEPTFDPAPADRVTEEGGQQVARFVFKDVLALTSAGLTMRVRARLWNITFEVLPSDVGTLKDIPADIRRVYLADGAKLDISHPLIRSIVEKLPGGDALSVARAAYREVAERIEYEMTGGWNAAPTVLARGTGSCSEYSFALMALLRAAGIPARYAGSFVVRGDDASWDEDYHRWVEAYLPGVGWFPLDANKGDSKDIKVRASGFGQLDNRVLVTTESPGGTPSLRWTYNVDARYVCAGKCTVVEDGVAEWSP